MKAATTLLLANLFSLGCVAGAVTMALHDKPGWGWLVFLAFITAHTINSDKK